MYIVYFHFRSSACKNMGVACWKMAKAKMHTDAKSSIITYHFQEGLKHFKVRQYYSFRISHDFSH